MNLHVWCHIFGLLRCSEFQPPIREANPRPPGRANPVATSGRENGDDIGDEISNSVDCPLVTLLLIRRTLSEARKIFLSFDRFKPSFDRFKPGLNRFVVKTGFDRSKPNPA